MLTKFSYKKTNPGKEKIILTPGVYRIDCWGAQGGSGLFDGKITTEGGKGAHVSGVLSLKSYLPIFLYVGGKGANGSPTQNTFAQGGYNGGGNGGADTNDNDSGGAGGGATDLRLVDDEINASESIYSRIMIAAGGSGSVYSENGAPDGDITGYISNSSRGASFIPSSTNQTYGAQLGIGQNGQNSACSGSSGGGGGYWGGYSMPAACSSLYQTIASSGSSFVSGHPECISITKNGEKSAYSIHYSGIKFSHTIIENGQTTFKSPSNVDEKGHPGDGAIVITSISFYITCKANNYRDLFIYLLIFILNNQQI